MSGDNLKKTPFRIPIEDKNNKLSSQKIRLFGG